MINMLDGGPELSREDLLDSYTPDDPTTLRVNFVTSADGAVEVDGHSAGLSGEADKLVFGLLRALCDGLMVGAGTLRHEGYRAVALDEQRRAERRERGLAEVPTLVVVSRGLGLEPTNPALAGAPVRPIVLTHASAPPERRAALETVADVVVAGDGEVDLTAGVAELRRRGLRHLLCEGGPHLFGGLVAQDLVDEVCLTVSPLLAGAGAARIIAGPTLTDGPHTLTLRHTLRAEGALLLRYTR